MDWHVMQVLIKAPGGFVGKKLRVSFERLRVNYE